MNIDLLDLFTTVLGLVYIWLEYRAHIALWVVGIVMPALDVYLYYSHGLYGDAGMAVYYTLAAVYGYVAWKLKERRAAARLTSACSSAAGGDGGQTAATTISHMPIRLYLPVTAAFLATWAATYYILIRWTNSTVPLLDAFTNALSFVGLWALARKYVEQWFFWIVVDVVCTVLYVQKGIPFKAGLYALYVVIAVFGYFKWKRMMTPPAQPQATTAGE